MQAVKTIKTSAKPRTERIVSIRPGARIRICGVVFSVPTKNKIEASDYLLQPYAAKTAPISCHPPFNARAAKIIKDGLARKNLNTYASVDEMFEKLGIQ